MGVQLAGLLKWRLTIVLRPRDLLIAIVDGEHARFVRPGPNNTLHRDSAFDSISAHKQSAALGSDHPGASFHTGSSAAHAERPRHDLHRMEKGKFAHLIGDELNAAAARAEFYELVIVAPAHVVTSILDRLDVATRATLIGTLKKDLVKTPDHELWPYLAKWVGSKQGTMKP
jgi:protein required for attachment to host cells